MFFTDGEQRTIKRALVAAFWVAVAVLCAYLLFKYLFAWLAPFIVAWIIAFFLQPAAGWLHKRTRVPRKLCAILLTTLLFALAGTVIVLAVVRAVTELANLSENLAAYIPGIAALTDRVAAWFEGITGGPQALGGLVPSIQQSVTSGLTDAAKQLGASLPGILAAIFSSVPKILFFTALLVVSAYYIGADYDRINRFVLLQIPSRVRSVIIEIKNIFKRTIYRYFRAYAILAFITFLELYIGFLIIRINYAILLAAAVCVVDVLPVLGVGTVLIPWGVYSLFTGDIYTGAALLILYGAILVMRNILEPRIVGRSIGLYPLLTLISMYVGFRIFGVAGMVLLPMSAVLLINYNNRSDLRLWKMPGDSSGDKKGREKEREKGEFRR